MTSLDVLQSMLPLFLIILLLFGVLYFVKKKGFGVAPKMSKEFGLKVLSTQAIMPKKYISMIKLQDKILVVGIAENSITLLKEIDVPEDYSIKNQPAIAKNSFKELLQKNLGIK